jgi:hypothetical protein
MIRFRTRVAVTAALLSTLAMPAFAQRGPAPAMTGLPEDVLALVCAPRPAFDVPDQALRLTGGQDGFRRRTYAPGDLVTINAGRVNGIEPGQQYFVRRLQTEANQRPSSATPGSIRTAGWIKVYAVDEELSLATIVHACDTMDVGDYLEPFELPVVPRPSSENVKPQRDNYGVILFGADFRRSFGKGDFFVVNRGTDHGVAPGDRFVIYRDIKQAENFLYNLGEAVAVEVKADTSTLQATVSRDAFKAGDYVALRKLPTPTPQLPAPK